MDNTLDLQNKQALLTILDRQSESEKLQSLAEVYTYSPLSPNQRLRSLVDLRHFLSDWALACCFHLARQMPLESHPGSAFGVPPLSNWVCARIGAGLSAPGFASDPAKSSAPCSKMIRIRWLPDRCKN